MPAPASAQSGETVQIEGQATMLATAAPSFNTPTNKIIWEIDLDIKLLDGFDWTGKQTLVDRSRQSIVNQSTP